MEKANELIKKIVDIEKSALKMSDASGNDKREADEEYQKKIVEFDKKIEEEYQKKYETLILEIDNEFNNELEAFYIEQEKELKELDERKAEMKKVWVDGIIKDITGV